jgi:hypothetical protein
MATVEMTAGPAIEHGHVGAWVGVGGGGLGPGGTDEWLQVGFATTDSTETHVYYELAKPYGKPRFVSLAGSVAIGQLHRLGVVEMIARPDWWRVWLDGRPVTRPIFLPSSHARWVPVATSESWNGGVASCNAFGYRFLNIRWSVNTRELWRPLKNAYSIDAPGYSVRRTASAGMVVAGGKPPAPLAPAESPLPGTAPPVITE